MTISKPVRALADRTFDLYIKNNLGSALSGLSSLEDAEIPSISPDAVAARALDARDLMAHVDALLAQNPGHDDEMLLGLVQYNAQMALDEETFYWNTFDYEPFFNPLTQIFDFLPRIPLTDESGARLYVRLVQSFADQTAEMLTKAKGQYARGMLLAKPLAKLAAGVFRSLAKAESPLLITAERGAEAPFEIASYRDAVAAAVARVHENCTAMADFLENEYYDAAPAEIGYAQYDNGSAYYASGVRRCTTLDVRPEEIFTTGKKHRAAIEAEMARIRSENGYHCTREEFTARIMKDPAWRMDTPEEFGRRLNACVERIQPLMDTYFGIPIVTPCAAVRLTPEVEPYAFNGIYTPANPPITMRGEFHYNGLRMDEKNPLKTDSMGYHELLPGHHYQISVVQESTALHPLVKATIIPAYNEGWAEYAAAFAGEIGLYDSPLSAYGRLEMDLYITNFLIIDTAINAMGWNMETLKADIAPYLPDYQGDALTNQLMRLTQSIPGLPLSYKMGSLAMAEFRRDAETRLGDRFDIRDYHKTVVEWGALPLYLLKKHIDWYVDQTLNTSEPR